ncbi:MAG: hypothetical protein ACI841_004124 [Planctomycetota bacterium]|jgi:hypothetical protein
MDALLLADLIVVVHLAVVLFVLFGQLAVVAGGCMRRTWIRSMWFRWSHALMILAVVGQTAIGKLCFLTLWEADLRRSAGQQPDDVSFVGRLARDVLYVEVEQAILNKIYYGFGALVLLSWILWPPRRKRAGLDSDQAKTAA